MPTLAAPRNTFRVEESASIDAAPATVYDLIADYRGGHQKIVPPQYFQNLRAVSGGYGAGTEITFDMRAFGQTVTSRGTVSEPEPGRVLVEAYTDGIVTTFIVDPAGAGCRVTLRSDIPERGGIFGGLYRGMTSRFVRKVFVAELAQIAAVARTVSAAPGRPRA